jgi:uncharacterized tellurite resistance protein B-like protein
MADWQKILREVLLADGTVDAAETSILAQEIMADGMVDEEEVNFLVDLRANATNVCPEFSTLFFTALKSNVLADGEVDADEAKRLREIVFADGIIDANEKAFLTELKNDATSLSPEFEALFAECMR